MSRWGVPSFFWSGLASQATRDHRSHLSGAYNIAPSLAPYRLKSRVSHYGAGADSYQAPVRTSRSSRAAGYVYAPAPSPYTSNYSHGYSHGYKHERRPRVVDQLPAYYHTAAPAPLSDPSPYGYGAHYPSSRREGFERVSTHSHAWPESARAHKAEKRHAGAGTRSSEKVQDKHDKHDKQDKHVHWADEAFRNGRRDWYQRYDEYDARKYQFKGESRRRSHHERSSHKSHKSREDRGDRGDRGERRHSHSSYTAAAPYYDYSPTSAPAASRSSAYPGDYNSYTNEVNRRTHKQHKHHRLSMPLYY